ncbi:PepSY domain-containing protein [Streptomyces sp. SID9913]|uniref:PepSY domain-containing protein n=1 Tax=Streptomyces sp. SID9913 TaxID=2706117 RepID=UPI0013DB7231|nr:PepSY domain-containing protein [Streptomyces sp. SID9913]MBM7091570.1 PepSY domain-containing protein [Streptomyces sp. S12]NED18893.1 PepSY domain-containing protein [Streptomyces sp. SID9913]
MKRNIVIAVVTATALVGGATATALAVSGDDAPTTRQADTRFDDRTDDRDDDGRDDDRDDRDDRDGARAASAKVTAADAIAAALEHRPGTAVSAELDDRDDDRRAVWEVDVLAGGDNWYSVRIDPATGKVLGSQKDDEDDADEVRAALKGASVSAQDAARAAAAKGTVTSVELEDDDERGWEVETTNARGAEKDWHVDLKSGKVTADRDDDADDSDDD